MAEARLEASKRPLVNPRDIDIRWLGHESSTFHEEKSVAELVACGGIVVQDINAVRIARVEKRYMEMVLRVVDPIVHA